MSRLVTSRDRGDAGFTLVELLVVIVLMGVVGTIFLSTVVSATQVDRKTRARADVQQEVTVGLERISKEVRVAAPLVSVADQQVVVDVYPTQPSGTTLRQRHTFTVAAGELSQQVQTFSPATSNAASSTSTRVLARGLEVAAPSFVGRDKSGNPTVVAAKVVSIDVVLVGKGSAGKTFPVSNTLFLRNSQR